MYANIGLFRKHAEKRMYRMFFLNQYLFRIEQIRTLSLPNAPRLFREAFGKLRGRLKNDQKYSERVLTKLDYTDYAR